MEFHDAHIRNVELHLNGEGALHWQHLAIFSFVEKDEFDVWSCSATLLIKGVRSLAVHGKLDDSFLMDGDFWDANHTPVDPTAFFEETAVASATFSFQGGTKIELTCDAMKLVDVVPLSIVERWSGPL